MPTNSLSKDRSKVIAIHTACCCGNVHMLVGDSYQPTHHARSYPRGYCEFCWCDRCQRIRKFDINDEPHNVRK